jgi:hypothetical protein
MHLRTHIAEKIMALITKGALGAQPAHADGGQSRRATHTRARPLTNIDLDKPGRLRVGHLLTLFTVSHSTLYLRIKQGYIPAPDGKDGSRPYWQNATIRAALMK